MPPEASPAANNPAIRVAALVSIRAPPIRRWNISVIGTIWPPS
jgi:hypothetical protein